MRPNFITIIIQFISGSLRLVKIILSIIASVLLLGTTVFVLIYFYFAKDMPDIPSLIDYKPPVLSQVIADDGGTVVGEFWTECRILVPYKDFPKIIMQAFIASEDSRFFEHKGVDMRSIMRAFLANLRAGEITQGGSTITQQITRSILLTQERTINRKIKEAILATRLERSLNKEQILTLYLNQIFLGNRAYGVTAAARNYFHKNLNQLTLAEVAVLAGLPSAPVRFSPVNNPKEARERQIHVLNRMFEEGLITEEKMKEAQNERLTVYEAGVDKDFGLPEAAFFVEHIRRLVKENYGDDTLYKGGLKIYTTVNVDKQRYAYKAVRDGVEFITRRQGWKGPIGTVDPVDIGKESLSIEDEILKGQNKGGISFPQNGEGVGPRKVIFDLDTKYRAIVTGFHGKDTDILVGKSTGVILFNELKWARNFSTKRENYDGVDYVKDPRKILKAGDVIYVRYLRDNEFALFQEPLVQAAIFSMDPHDGEVKAMIGGYDFSKSEFNRAVQAVRQPGSSFKPFVYAAALDKGYTFNTGILDFPVEYIVGKGEVWSPKNYGGFKGPTTFHNAIVFSMNVPTVKIVADIGTHYLTAYARKLGITTPIDKYLSMALGANGVSLSDMVPAYSTFLNLGVYKEPVYIRKIVDAKGNLLESKKTGATLEKPSGVNQISMEQLDPKEVGLNTELFDKNRIWVENDQLTLTDTEIKTLYGEAIPKGYVMTPQTAYLMVTLLRHVVEGGTGTKVRELGKPAAGKTGTTNDESDAWFIGFVPDLAAGVWVGFDELIPIGRKETGGRTAAPIFVAYMKEAAKEYGAKDFVMPQGFPAGSQATLCGGSALSGTRLALDEFGADGELLDRAAFFEEDMEDYMGEGQPEDKEESGTTTPDNFGF